MKKITIDNYQKLSSQELEILNLLVQGSRTSEIAKRLKLDYKMVAGACKAIKLKLNVDTIEGLVKITDQYKQQNNR